VPNHHFISYSRSEAKDFALRLGDDLAIGDPPVHAWLDCQDIPAGVDWDEAIAEAIKTCETLIFIMTPDSVRPNSECKNEWVCALRYKKAVVPLLLNASAEAPFRLYSRQHPATTGWRSPGYEAICAGGLRRRACSRRCVSGSPMPSAISRAQGMRLSGRGSKPISQI
jgi:TIR domain